MTTSVLLYPRLPKVAVGHIAFRRDVSCVRAYICNKSNKCFKFTFKLTLTLRLRFSSRS